MLTKLKHYVPGYILYSLYCTLVLPYVNYGILIWGNTYKVYLDKIFKLQKWAIRTISLEHYRSHTGPLFKKKQNVLNVLLHLNWNLEYSCTSTKQTNFHRRLKIISLNIAKSITILQEMTKIQYLKIQKKFSLNNLAYFMEFFGFKTKILQNCEALQKRI